MEFLLSSFVVNLAGFHANVWMERNLGNVEFKSLFEQIGAGLGHPGNSR